MVQPRREAPIVPAPRPSPSKRGRKASPDETWLAGVDGCRAGWIRAARELETGRVCFDLLPDAAAIWARSPHPTWVAIDIPIGLPAAGPRSCDREARRLLGPRRSSVFPAPIRAALAADSRVAADAITRRIVGRGVSAQAWGLYAKVREVDTLLARDRRARGAMLEIHPELSFRAWNDGAPMAASKKTAEGLRARGALAERWLGADLLARARGAHPKKDLADDDILDAVAALWTAHRVAGGEAVTLPGDPPLDETGLPMRIVY